jgi:hypothetical protein
MILKNGLRAGIADGGEFYIRSPGTAGWIFDTFKCYVLPN